MFLLLFYIFEATSQVDDVTALASSGRRGG